MTVALAVAVIAKHPRPGAVKTRLTPPLDPCQAAGLAECALRDTLDVVAGLDVGRRILFWDRPTAEADLAAGFEVVPQPSGTLDERLAHLFDLVREPLLIVGMDTPQLTASDLAPAFAGDEGVDAWIGHAEDGGYWALAIREPGGHLVRGIPMSRTDTGALQHHRLVAAGLSVAELPVLRDFDTVDDLSAVAALAPHSRFARAWARISDEVAVS